MNYTDDTKETIHKMAQLKQKCKDIKTNEEEKANITKTK